MHGDKTREEEEEDEGRESIAITSGGRGVRSTGWLAGYLAGWLAGWVLADEEGATDLQGRCLGSLRAGRRAGPAGSRKQEDEDEEGTAISVRCGSVRVE